MRRNLSVRLRSRPFGCLAGLVLAASLVGCAGLGGSPKDVVASRAQARWDALIRGDLKTAYTYLSPGYRKAKSFERYKRTIFGVGKWKSAQVGKVECLQPDVCRVWVNVGVRLQVPRRGEPIESVNPVLERWILRDGQWWYVPAR